MKVYKFLAISGFLVTSLSGCKSDRDRLQILDSSYIVVSQNYSLTETYLSGLSLKSGVCELKSTYRGKFNGVAQADRKVFLKHDNRLEILDQQLQTLNSIDVGPGFLLSIAFGKIFLSVSASKPNGPLKPIITNYVKTISINKLTEIDSTINRQYWSTIKILKSKENLVFLQSGSTPFLGHYILERVIDKSRITKSLDGICQYNCWCLSDVFGNIIVGDYSGNLYQLTSEFDESSTFKSISSLDNLCGDTFALDESAVVKVCQNKGSDRLFYSFDINSKELKKYSISLPEFSDMKVLAQDQKNKLLLVASVVNTFNNGQLTSRNVLLSIIDENSRLILQTPLPNSPIAIFETSN